MKLEKTKLKISPGEYTFKPRIQAIGIFDSQILRRVSIATVMAGYKTLDYTETFSEFLKYRKEMTNFDVYLISTGYDISEAPKYVNRDYQHREQDLIARILVELDELPERAKKDPKITQSQGLLIAKYLKNELKNKNRQSLALFGSEKLGKINYAAASKKLGVDFVYNDQGQQFFLYEYLRQKNTELFSR